MRHTIARYLSLITLGLALLVAVPALAVGSNGSFEAAPADPGVFTTVNALDTTSITNWSVDSGSVDYIGSYWNAADGTRSIDLDGNEQGAISQIIPTVIGDTYTVTFDLSGNPDNGPTLMSLQVGATGAAPQGYTFDTSVGNTHTDMMWTPETYTFVATSASTVLSFASQTPGAYGPVLDNVQITEQAPACNPTASQTIVSDTGTYDVTDRHAAVPVIPHSAWLANVSIPGATWIWNAEKGPATDDSGSNRPGTVTFTRTFTITGTPTGATLDITTDNSYIASINGHAIGSDGVWQSVETYTIPAADLVSGTNVLTVVATNDGPDGPGNPAGLLYKLTISNNECVTPPPPTSTVTMCKTDTKQQPLSGWSLVLKGDMVEDLTVPTNVSSGINSVTSLTSGVSYVATAVGTWLNQNGANPVDPEYSTTDNWTTHMDGYTGYQTDILELQINSTFDPNSNWGAYNSAHTYAQSFVGSGAPANFRIFDGTGTTLNEGWYGDNSGTLAVTLNKGYAGITDQTGCVTFTGVPYGAYTVGELGQDGWTNDSGLGPVVVNAPTETYTVVNHLVTGSLTVTKNTIGGNGTFTFTGIGNGFSVTTTLGTGATTLAGLVPGSYTVIETAQAGWNLTSNTCAQVAVVADQTATCTVTNTAQSSISGMKFNDLNRNGKQDANEQGLQGWTIQLKDTKGNVIASTVTGADGTYTFTNVASGTYKVREVHQHGWKRMSKNPKAIVVTPGTVVTGVTFGNAQVRRGDKDDTDKDDNRDDRSGSYQAHGHSDYGQNQDKEDRGN